MQQYLTLLRRELAAFFVSMAGYAIIAGAVFLGGLGFVDVLTLLNSDSMPAPVTQLYFSTSYFWLMALLTTPVITMRLFALEKFSGTFETLMTAPISDLQVVLAKFSAALIFYLVMWLPSLGWVFVLRHYASAPGMVDAGMLASTFLGILLIGALFLSFGCFASALTKSQIVAAMVSFTLGFGLYLLSYLHGHLPLTGWEADLLGQIALFDQMNDFARGTVDTRHVVFFASTSIFFLFLTLRVVESRRWK